MLESDIKKFLKLFGINNTRVMKDWVQFPCFLAPWTHGSGKDSNPSANISIHKDRNSMFYCFGCSESPVSLMRLVHDYWLNSGIYRKDAYRFVFFTENSEPQEEQPKEFEKWVALPPEIVQIFDEDINEDFPLLDSFTDNNQYSQFLKKRKVSLSTAKKLKVRIYPKHEALGFPFTDYNGNMHALRFRQIKQKKIFTGSANILGLPRVSTLSESGSWFGLDTINIREPVIIVEGEIDCLRMHTEGFTNTIASGGSKVTDAQLRNIFSSHVILAMDSDTEGRRATQRMYGYFRDKALVSIVDWAGVGCKDPGDTENANQIKTALSKAKFML